MIRSEEVENEGVARATLFAFQKKFVKSHVPLAGVMATLARTFLLVILLSLFFLSPKSANAQAVTFTPVNNMQFPNESAAGTYYVNCNQTGAAAFDINWPTYTTGPANTIAFVASAYLTNVGGDQLTFSINNNGNGNYNFGEYKVTETGAETAFNPSAGINSTAQAATHIDYFLVGGAVTVPTNYVVGTYTGQVTVTVTVTYNSKQCITNFTYYVSVTLTGSVSLSANGTLNFNPAIAGTTPTLSAKATGAPTFTATGTRSTSTVTYSTTLSLTGPGTALTFTPSLYGSATNSQSGSQLITSGKGLGGTGYFYFWLGGSLGAIPAGQLPGAYSGTFVLRLTY